MTSSFSDILFSYLHRDLRDREDNILSNRIEYNHLGLTSTNELRFRFHFYENNISPEFMTNLVNLLKIPNKSLDLAHL